LPYITSVAESYAAVKLPGVTQLTLDTAALTAYTGGMKSQQSSSKRQESRRRYEASDKGKARRERYEATAKAQARKKRYEQAHPERKERWSVILKAYGARSK